MSNQQGANGPAGHTSAPPKAAQAGGKAFSNAAKKDPALFPLAMIFGAAFLTAGYFFTTRWSGASSPEKQFAPVSQPWDSKNGTQSALYKYRYANKQGKLEDAAPATSYETVPITGNIDRLRKFNVPHEQQDK